MIDPHVEEVLEKLAYHRAGALVPVADLPRVLDADAVGTLRTIVRLRSLGLVDLWDLPAGDEAVLVAVLTARSAAALGVELEANDGRDLTDARWVARGRSRLPKWQRKRRAGRALLVDGDFRPEDPDAPTFADCADYRTCDPSVQAELRDALERPRFSWLRGVEPYVILGAAAVWPPRPDPDTGACPGCGERWKAPGTMCIACGRGSTDSKVAMPRFDSPAATYRAPAPRTPLSRPKRTRAPVLDPKPACPAAGFRMPSRSARPRPRPRPRPQAGR